MNEKNTDNPSKSFYAIIPANVRYDRNLKANAKLLYGEITALCNEKGYCWASNRYFAELYAVSKTSISNWINQLVKGGYISSEIKYKEGTKEILHRYIRIVYGGMQEKFNTPIKEKFKDNNTIDNNTINKKINKKGKQKYKSSYTFDQFVTDYGYRTSIGQARDYWARTVKEKDKDHIREVVHQYVSETLPKKQNDLLPRRSQKRQRKYLIYFLKHKVYLDYEVKPRAELTKEQRNEYDTYVATIKLNWPGSEIGKHILTENQFVTFWEKQYGDLPTREKMGVLKHATRRMFTKKMTNPLFQIVEEEAYEFAKMYV